MQHARDQEATDASQQALFEAVITPHASLGRRGWRWLLIGLLAAVGLTSLRFWLAGAWPVAVFAVLEVGFFLFMFWLHRRAMRQAELVQLTPSTLSVVRIDPSGLRTERRWQPAWLSVILQERSGRVPALLLSSRGRREEIARMLGEPEKRDLAAALDDALYRLRNPRFDNPQLREADC